MALRGRPFGERKAVTKKMVITFPKESVSAVAVFLEDEAPKTCAAIWNLLEKGPIESEAIHAMFAGREIAVEIPKPDDEIPPENMTVTPAPGEILYMHFPKGIERGFAGEIWEFAIFYGPDSRIFIPLGWVAGNLFARITENLDAFAEVARRTRIEGIKKITLKRVE